MAVKGYEENDIQRMADVLYANGANTPMMASEMPDVAAALFRSVTPTRDHYVTYRQFGAVLDGTTDDSAAVLAAHEYANARGIPVIEAGGRLKCNFTVNVKTSCYLDIEFIMDASTPDRVYQFLPDAYESSREWTGALSNVVSSKTFAGKSFNGIIDPTGFLSGKYCYVTSKDDAWNIGPRFLQNSYTSNTYKHTQPLAYDERGSRITSDFYAPASGTFTFYNIHDINQRPLEFVGGTVTNKVVECVSFPALVYCKRSGVTVRNISIKNPNIANLVTASGSSHNPARGGLLRFYGCANCVVEHIQAFNNSVISLSGQSSYVIDDTYCYNLIVRDVNASQGWGIHASHWSDSVAVYDSLISRFDMHYGMHGIYRLSNCHITTWPATIAVGYGSGDLVIDHCTFDKHATHEVQTPISFRVDYDLRFTGRIFMDNVTLKGIIEPVINIYRNKGITGNSAFPSSAKQATFIMSNIESDSKKMFVVSDGESLPAINVIYRGYYDFDAASNVVVSDYSGRSGGSGDSSGGSGSGGTGGPTVEKEFLLEDNGDKWQNENFSGIWFNWADYNDGRIKLTVGHTYQIVFDGVTTTSVAKMVPTGGQLSGLYVGNLSLETENSADNTGEKFLLVSNGTYYLIYAPVGVHTLNIKDVSESGSSGGTGGSTSTIEKYVDGDVPYLWVVDGYKIDRPGHATADSNFELRRYTVVAGSLYHIVTSADSPVSAQWQSSGSTTTLIGDHYYEGEIDIYDTAPEGATNLILCCLKTNTTAYVKNATKVIEEVWVPGTGSDDSGDTGSVAVSNLQSWKDALKATPKFTQVETATNVKTIVADGKYIYVAGQRGFEKWDVSCEFAPTLVASNKPYTSNLRRVYRILSYGDYIIGVVRHSWGGKIENGSDYTQYPVGHIYVLAKADLSVKKVIDFTHTDPFVGSNAIIYNDKLIVSGQIYGFRVYSLANPLNPQLLCSYKPSLGLTSPRTEEYQGGCFYTDGSGNLIFAVAGYDDGIKFFKFNSTFTSYEVVGTFIHWNHYQNDHVFWVEARYPYVYCSLAPDTSYTTTSNHQGVLTLDVRNLADIKHTLALIDAEDLNTYTQGDPNPQCLIIFNGKVLVNNGNKGIAVFTLENPANPKYRGCIPSDDWEIMSISKTADGRLLAGSQTPSGFQIFRGV